MWGPTTLLWPSLTSEGHVGYRGRDLKNATHLALGSALDVNCQ